LSGHFSNTSVSAQLFSVQNAASLLVNPSHVTRDAILVGASSRMPGSPHKAHEEFPDLDRVAKEHELGSKHVIPDPEVFVKFCGECY